MSTFVSIHKYVFYQTDAIAIVQKAVICVK